MPRLVEFPGRFEGSDDNSVVPVFPPEIECQIFEIAAQIPRNSINLALVSRRTQIWVERLIYNTVTLSDERTCSKFLQTLDTRPNEFFIHNVKSLCIPGDIKPLCAKRVLNVCQGVENLAVWLPLRAGASPLFPCVSSLRPRRISINVSGLYGLHYTPDFAHPFFSKVTHLELVDWLYFDLVIHAYLTLDCLFPHLTHLALDVDPRVDTAPARLRAILASCCSLVICLGLVPDDETMILASDELAVIVGDPRLVILSDSEVPVESWEASLWGTADSSVWALAEDIVAARSGKISM